MGLQQQQDYCNQQQQLVIEQQQQLLMQHQQTVNLLQQHQQEQQQQQSQQQNNHPKVPLAVERSRKESLMSTGSQTGDSLVSSPTKCPDDVFPSHASPSALNNRKSASSPGASPITPLSSASSSLSSATGRNMGKRQEADGSAAVGDRLVNDLTDKLSLDGKSPENKDDSSIVGFTHAVMQRSDRPSSLDDQSCDRASISSCTSNTSGGRDSLDGASITGPSPGQRFSTSSLERVDRPSSRSSTGSTSSLQHPRQHQYTRQCSGVSTTSGDSTGSGRETKGANNDPAPEQEKTVSGKILLKSKSEMNFDLQKKEREKSARFLPRNESMRMDRPSQYS